MEIKKYTLTDGDNNLSIVAVTSYSVLSPMTTILVYINEIEEFQAHYIAKYVDEELIKQCKRKVYQLKRLFMKRCRSQYGDDKKENKKRLRIAMKSHPRFKLLHQLIQDTVLFNDSLILDLHNYREEIL